MLGLFGGHGFAPLKRPGGLLGGKPGSHAGHSKLAGLLGGLSGHPPHGGGKGKGTPQKLPPAPPGDGGSGGGESGGKPAPPGPIPLPGTSLRNGGTAATSSVTDRGAGNAGSVPSSKPGSPSVSAVPESTTSTPPRSSPSSNSLSTSQPYSGTPSLPLSASAPPAQSPTVAPGGSTAAPSTGTSNNQPNSSGGGQKGFPLAAAGVLGAVLSFLVVSGIIWGLWYFLRARRRRRAHRASLLKWDFDVRTESKRETAASSRFAAGLSGTLSTSTIPYFISAEEAGHRDVVKRRSDSSFEHAHASAAIPNLFAHPSDVREADPFDAADTGSGTLQRGNTQMTRSTMSV